MFTVPSLPYSYDALEPYIDAQTMQLHHDKHHQAYVDNLNAALKDHRELQDKSIEYLLTHLAELPESIRQAVRNNGGGHYNHTFFWQILKKNNGAEPAGPLKGAIEKTFGNYQMFQEQFNGTAKKVFGSGWAWLCLDKNKSLSILSTPNQDCPISYNLQPILGLDVWEHAYYLKYQNRRPDYISAWWQVVNWDYVQHLYDQLIKSCC
ncbi:MAG: superoxide dismutase [Candidatus Dependentiae bacterium]